MGVILETPRLRLRPFVAGDFADLYAFYRLPEVAQYLYWEARDEAATAKALEKKQGMTMWAKEGDTLLWGVVLPQEERLIGEVMLAWQSDIHRQGEVGFVFHPGYQGVGYATEATSAILDWGFSMGGLHRIYGRCDTRNEGSYRLMERLGMRREAHFRHNEWFKGAWGDEYVYAILAEEWQGRERS
ncbi:MAG TPA: GNAT family protein [Anaerolineae bacterium]|nr:GNAT family protein [Anaerolineae bacterium]